MIKLDERKLKTDIESQFNKIFTNERFIIRNNNTNKVLDVNNSTLEDIVNFVATLVKVLQSKNIL